jgi:hypothetical protein
MFRKIVSNLTFSPALIGQLGFYAKRLRKEEATRRIGLIFTALALIVQSFAVFTPPESANAANGNNIIYGGFKNKNDLLNIYDRNKDSAGHKDLQQIYSHFGITRQDIVNSNWSSFNSRNHNNSIRSVGRSTYSFQRTPLKIADSNTTVYSSLVSGFDSTSWSKKNGSMYTAVIGKRAIDGKWFAIMSGCGNPAYISIPPIPPKPTAACSTLAIAPITRTKFTLKAAATASNGAKLSGYTYVVKDSTGAVIYKKTQPTSSAVDSLTYNFSKDGKYTIEVTASTSIGQKTSSDCKKTLNVSPEPRCILNPDLVESSPDCRPCENDKTIWYKDEDCTSNFVLTKSVRNVSQLVANANNTTTNNGDRLEYHLTVKNVGKTTGDYKIEDNLADVLEYADLIDTGGGTLLKKSDNVAVEKINTISWPSLDIKPNETIDKIVSVQVKSTTPATPKGLGNPESYDCRMVNDFAGNHTTISLQCPTAKVVEQVVSELPRTGSSENLIFAGVVITIVTYFYARSRQVKKEVRLIRRDLNSGTI